jgi:hypothetical protein
MAWTDDQRARKANAEAGFCVVANMHKGRDQALIAWARFTHRFLRIDHKTQWRNPFLTPDNGGLEEVVGKFATAYLPHKNALLAQINGGAQDVRPLQPTFSASATVQRWHSASGGHGTAACCRRLPMGAGPIRCHETAVAKRSRAHIHQGLHEASGTEPLGYPAGSGSVPACADL